VRRNASDPRAFVAFTALSLVIGLSALVAATQYGASKFRYHPALGLPLVEIGHLRIYSPWACMEWSRRFEARAPRVIHTVQAIGLGGGLLAFLTFLAGASRAKGRPVSDLHGSARWADEADLKSAGLLDAAGIVLCQTAEARYTSRSDEAGGRIWRLRRPGRLVRHTGPEHVMVFAPTRTGKGIGTVVPSLLAWQGSTVVYDLKKELWSLTAGWRRTFSHCWRFEPTSPHSVRFNPLFEVGRGPGDVRDAQTIAEMVIDPDGKGDKDHWRLSGAALLTAAILHVLYGEEDKSLQGVSALLSDPGRSQFEVLEAMMNTQHLPQGPHPVVARTARAMLNKSENELSGVVSTAKAALTLYDDPIVAANTARSDFRIADLMNAENPVSLYLVVPPSDIDRTRPLVRLMLNQIGKRLTERMEFEKGAKGYKHRLLLLLDEFPSLGKLPFFQTALAFAAGYGIKAFMICQSLNQLEDVYGKSNSILDNSHVRMTYTANDFGTAKQISDLCGQATVQRVQRSRSDKGIFGSRSLSESEQELGRALLTPDEVLTLPFDESILLVGGRPPYRGRKLMYYLDPRFKDLVDPERYPAPDSRRAQAGELLKAVPTEWVSAPRSQRAAPAVMDTTFRPAPPTTVPGVVETISPASSFPTLGDDTVEDPEGGGRLGEECDGDDEDEGIPL